MTRTRALPIEDRKPTTAEDLRAMLRRKFPADQFAMLYEVRDAAGFNARRSADVVMVGLWPSRGCQIEGMEIKVTRSDWLRELARPDKGEAFVGFCDRWWIVAGHDEIVESHELPNTWGLMVAGSRGLSIAAPAPLLQPKPLDRTFLAAMLKRATGTNMDRPEVVAAIASAAAAARAQGEATAKYLATHAERDLEGLRATIKEFERASGVELSLYGGKHIGDAVRLVIDGKFDARRRDLLELRRRARRIAESLDELFPDEASDARPA